ncbi:unnamed protein product [Parajaminaea phylloscopi]
MAPPLSLAQSSFLLSSLLSDKPHRLDQRGLLDPRALVLDPAVEAASATVTLGETSLSCRVSTQVVKANDQVDEEDRDDPAAGDEGDADGATGLWTVAVQTSPGCEVPLRNGGNSSTSGNVELDASLEVLAGLLKRHLLATFPVDQFIILESPAFTESSNPSSSSSSTHLVSSRERLRGATFWGLSIDVTIHSMAGGNLYDAIWAAVYAALFRTRIPRTREVAYAPPDSTSRKDATDVDMEDVGIKSLKGKGGKARAIDFELVDVWDEGLPIKGMESMGVGLTLGMLPNHSHLLDPSLDEELCLPSSRRLFVVAAPPTQTSGSVRQARLHHTHLLPSLLNLTAGEATQAGDSTGGLDHQHNLRFPVVSQAKEWEECNWGVPNYARVREALDIALPLVGAFGTMLRQTLQTEQTTG